MQYTHKNITLDVSHLTHPEFTGHTEMNLSKEQFATFLEDSCIVQEFVRYTHLEEMLDHIDADDMADVFRKEYEEEELTIHNADLIIGIYEHCLELDGEFTFQIDTEHISWPIHDMLHAEHDAAGCTIYVESEIERERILESHRIARKQFPNFPASWELFDNLEEEFRQRFRNAKGLCLDEFRHPEEY